jgi:hypothetical protein
VTEHDWLALAVMATAPAGAVEADLALIAHAGDALAGQALTDFVEETGVQHSPFKVGETVFIQTVTLYYLGEVTEVGLGFVRLRTSSWVHWTARLSLFLATGKLNKSLGGRKPRLEYVGDYTILTQSIVGFAPWPHALPTESIQ